MDATGRSPVRRVEIPKPGGGGTRMLGIPTVVDRLIQQALLQKLTPIFDPTFSKGSYGFRPGRSAHQAVLRARGFAAEGRTWVVDLDLEKFFDRVNHDVLMARVARQVKDGRVLRLIRRYLQAGMLEGGVVVTPRTARHLHWRYSMDRPFDDPEKIRLQQCVREAAHALNRSEGNRGTPQQAMLESFAGYLDRQRSAPASPDRDEAMSRKALWHIGRMPAGSKC